MHDDGLHNDGAANDGIYGATFQATEVGDYVLQALLAGVDNDGPFIRSAEHFVTVLPPMIKLSGNAL